MSQTITVPEILKDYIDIITNSPLEKNWELINFFKDPNSTASLSQLSSVESSDKKKRNPVVKASTVVNSDGVRLLRLITSLENRLQWDPCANGFKTINKDESGQNDVVKLSISPQTFLSKWQNIFSFVYSFLFSLSIPIAFWLSDTAENSEQANQSSALFQNLGMISLFSISLVSLFLLFKRFVLNIPTFEKAVQRNWGKYTSPSSESESFVLCEYCVSDNNWRGILISPLQNSTNKEDSQVQVTLLNSSLGIFEEIWWLPSSFITQYISVQYSLLLIRALSSYIQFDSLNSPPASTSSLSSSASLSSTPTTLTPSGPTSGAGDPSRPKKTALDDPKQLNRNQSLPNIGKQELGVPANGPQTTSGGSTNPLCPINAVASLTSSTSSFSSLPTLSQSTTTTTSSASTSTGLSTSSSGTSSLGGGTGENSVRKMMSLIEGVGILKEDWIEIKQYSSHWSKRWCVLYQNTILVLYSDQNKTEVIGWVNWKNCRITQRSSRSRSFILSKENTPSSDFLFQWSPSQSSKFGSLLLNQSKRGTFRTVNPRAAEGWIQTLENCFIENVKRNEYPMAEESISEIDLTDETDETEEEEEEETSEETGADEEEEEEEDSQTREMMEELGEEIDRIKARLKMELAGETITKLKYNNNNNNNQQQPQQPQQDNSNTTNEEVVDLAEVDSVVVARFYRFHGYQLEKTVAKLSKTLKWRKKREVDRITIESILPEITFHKGYFHGYDREGRPSVYIAGGKHSPGKPDPFITLNTVIYFLELFQTGAIRKHIRSESIRNENCFSVILDNSGVTFQNVDVPLLKEGLDILLSYYPALLAAVYVVKYPALVNSIWRTVRGWIPPVTRNKIHFIELKELPNYYAPDQLPSCLGGEATFVPQGNSIGLETLAPK